MRCPLRLRPERKNFGLAIGPQNDQAVWWWGGLFEFPCSRRADIMGKTPNSARANFQLDFRAMNDKSTAPGHEPAGPLLPGQPGPSHRILVVEDEPSIRQFVTNSLARAGYHVDSAEDGALAWEALQVRRYDLLITDNIMPRITGIALVKKLRGKSSTLPVVLATGIIPEEELEQHPSLGISEILLKPFTLEQILSTVNKVLCGVGSMGTDSLNPQLSK
jgi:CheY-like chemotaxis protein